MTETPKARQNLVSSLRRSRNNPASNTPSSSKAVEQEDPSSSRRVSIWQLSTKARLPDHCCPKVSNLDTYLALHSSDCEIYIGQDCKNFSASNGGVKGKVKRGKKKSGDKNANNGQIYIWSCSTDSRLEQSVPRCDLQAYLLEHKDCEVYHGQDGKLQDHKKKHSSNVDQVQKRKSEDTISGHTQVKSRRSSKKEKILDDNDNGESLSRGVGGITESTTTNELLESPYSVLTRLNLKDIISLEVFANVIPQRQQAILTSLLPTIDQTPQGLIDLFTNNVHFQSSLTLFQDLLAAGNFDPDVKLRNKMKRRRKENWDAQKEHQFEVYWGHKLDIHENIKDLDTFSNIQVEFLRLAQEVMEKQGKSGEAQDLEQKRKRLLQKHAIANDKLENEQDINSEEEEKKKVETNKKIADVMGMFPIVGKRKNG